MTKRANVAAAVAFILAVSISAFAAVPNVINFQGRLTDVHDTPVTTATAVTFKLFNAETGGTLVFNESQTVTPDANGLYNVYIGSVTALSGVNFGVDLWLEVVVGSEVLTPRYRLTTSPYAFQANTAAAVPWSGITGMPAGFADGTDDGSSGALGPNTVDTSHILDGTVALADLNTGSVDGRYLTAATVQTVTSSKTFSGGATVTGLPTPVAASDAVNKAYADSISAGSVGTDTIGTSHIINSTVALVDLNVTDVDTHYITTATAQTISGIKTLSADWVNTANPWADNEVSDTLTVGAAGSVNNTAIDSSSVTKQGNTFNGASQLVRLDSSGKLPAVDGSLLTNVAAGAPGANTVGTTQVIDSTVALVDLNTTDIDTHYVTTATAQTISGSKTFSNTITSANGNTMVRDANNDRLGFYSGTDVNNGASLEMYGKTHGSAPGNLQFFSNTIGGQGHFKFIATDGVGGFPTVAQIYGDGGMRMGGNLSTSPGAGSLQIAGLFVSSGGVNLSGGTTGGANAIDFGSGASDELTAAKVVTLTSGVNADSLHSHSGATPGNDSVGTTQIIASTVALVDLNVTDVDTHYITTATAQTISGVKTLSADWVNTANPWADNEVSDTLTVGAAGSVNNAAVDGSSVTKQGNTFNGASQLVLLDSSGKLPAVDGSLLTNVSAGAPGANTVGTTQVIDSTVALVDLNVTDIDTHYITTATAQTISGVKTLSADWVNTANPWADNEVSDTLTVGAAGSVNNAAIDGSSVTKQGNTFNSASQLVRLDASTRLPAVDGSLLTNISATLIGADAVGTTQIIASTIALVDLNITDIDTHYITTATAQTISGVKTLSADWVNTANPWADNEVSDTLTVGAAGSVNNAAVDGSSVTKQGNTFNGASQLVLLDSSGKLPAIDGSQLTNVSAGAPGANTVGTTQVIDSTVALVDLNTTDIDTHYVTTATAQTISGSKTFSNTITSANGNTMVRDANNDRLGFYSGTDVNGGASIELYGKTHGSAPGNVQLFSNTGGGQGHFKFIATDGVGGFPTVAQIYSDGGMRMGGNLSTSPGAGGLQIAGLFVSSGGVNLSGGTTGGANTIDFGSGASDELTAAKVVTLTSGGIADSLHTHTGGTPGNDSVGTTQIINSTVALVDLNVTDVDTHYITTATAQTISGVKTLSADWVNTANPWADNEVSDTLTVGASGSVNNAAIDASSVTKQGNTFNGASQLVLLDSSGKLPAIDGSQLTNVAAGSIGADTVGTTQIIASTIALVDLNVTDVDTHYITTATAQTISGVKTLSADWVNTANPWADNEVSDTLTVGAAGSVNNSAIDASSVTKQGNTFNGASQLVRLDASTKLPAVDGSLLTNVAAASIGADTIGTTQIVASTIALVDLNVTDVDTHYITTATAQTISGVKTLSADWVNTANPWADNEVSDTLTVGAAGSVNNAAIDASSVTKQGNTFNGASQLVRLDASTKLPAVDGSLLTNVAAASIGADTIGTTQIIASTIALVDLNVTDVDTHYITTATAQTISGVKTLSADWVNTANPWADNEVSDTLTVGAAGSVNNAAIDASSVTKQGNTFNGASQLVRLDASTKLPAVDGSLLTNVAAASIGADTIGTTQIIASTIALVDLNVTDVDTHYITTATAQTISGVKTLSADWVNTANPWADNEVSDTLTVGASGSVSNSAIDSSSVTKQGNTFNGASQLVQLDSSTKLPVVDASQLTNVTAAAVAANTVGTTQIINSTVALVDLNMTDIDTHYVTTGTAQTITGTKTFSNTLLLGNDTSISRDVANGRTLVLGSNATNTGALIEIYSTGIGFNQGNINFIANSAGGSGNFAFLTTPDGSSFSERLRLFADGGLQLGGAYGSSPGSGSLLVNSTVTTYGSILIPIANGIDNASPGITLASKFNDDFVYDSDRLNNFGLGFHIYGGTENMYLSDYFGIDFLAGAASRMRITQDGNVGVGTNDPKSVLHVNGPIATAVSASQTGTYTVAANDSVVRCDASGGAFTVNLPTASGITGRQYIIKKIETGGNAVTVDPNGGETVDGAATYSLAGGAMKYVVIVSDGANWLVVGNN